MLWWRSSGKRRVEMPAPGGLPLLCAARGACATAAVEHRRRSASPTAAPAPIRPRSAARRSRRSRDHRADGAAGVGIAADVLDVFRPRLPARRVFPLPSSPPLSGAVSASTVCRAHGARCATEVSNVSGANAPEPWAGPANSDAEEAAVAVTGDAMTGQPTALPTRKVASGGHRRHDGRPADLALRHLRPPRRAGAAGDRGRAHRRWRPSRCPTRSRRPPSRRCCRTRTKCRCATVG